MTLNIKNKKGIQLNQAFGAVLTLVLVAVLVIVAIVIFVSLTTSFVGTSSASDTAETLTAVTESPGVSLNAALTNCSFASPVVAAMTNVSGDFMTSGNYSVSSTGVVTFISVAATDIVSFNNTDWITNYSWTWGSQACEASEDMVTEFGNYTSLIGLVGTIIFLGLVIGVLVASFVFGRRERV